MVIPLYRCSSPPLEPKGNVGLWYDKFCDKWREDWTGLVDKGKNDWINAVVLKGEIGDENLLREIAERRNAHLSAMGGTALRFRTKGPFVTGLGRSHPVENGFAWHHSLGVPYLPGSSVKGMVRYWATKWNNLEDEAEEIFGPENSTKVGSVIFLDAIPVQPVKLKMEIMTPHYGPYYTETTKYPEPPADWHSPVPIPFLAVDAEQEFLFGLIPRDENTEKCQKAGKWLKEALQKIGAGAKTAVGYGRFDYFDLTSSGLEWLEEQASQHGMSIEDFVKDRFNPLASDWAAIEDPNLKASVYKEIKRIYQDIGYWTSAPTKERKKVIEKYYKAWEGGR